MVCTINVSRFHQIAWQSCDEVVQLRDALNAWLDEPQLARLQAIEAMTPELLRFIEDTIGTDNAFMRSWLARYAALTAAEVERVVDALGAQVGALPGVSHCYRRPRHLPDWPYNLFAMLHGSSREEVLAEPLAVFELPIATLDWPLAIEPSPIAKLP